MLKCKEQAVNALEMVLMCVCGWLGTVGAWVLGCQAGALQRVAVGGKKGSEMSLASAAYLLFTGTNNRPRSCCNSNRGLVATYYEWLDRNSGKRQNSVPDGVGAKEGPWVSCSVGGEQWPLFAPPPRRMKAGEGRGSWQKMRDLFLNTPSAAAGDRDWFYSPGWPWTCNPFASTAQILGL